MSNTPQRLLPDKGINLDIGDSYMPPNMARFIKNLSYVNTDTSEAEPSGKGGTGYFKPLEANAVYDPNFVLPGVPFENQNVGWLQSKEEDLVLFLNLNKNGTHGLYLIRGSSNNVESVYVKNCLNLILRPENFLHQGGGWLEVFNFTDPNTNLPRKRSYFMYTDGYNDMRFICLEDSIATQSFNASLFPYFVNPHPECLLINAGVPEPSDCLQVVEVPNDDPTKTNNLRFKTWQFRVKAIDVYGRMSEHGIISDLYIPGTNDCVGSSELLPRCLDIKFDAGSPLINSYQIEFSNNNGQVWYVDDTIFLYNGSNLGDWWLRSRNPNIPYDQVTNTLTYRFCRDKECNPVDVNETNRSQNPLPRQTQSVSKIGKVIGLWNNKHGFNPLGSEIMDQISLTVTPPSTAVSNVRNIEIYVPIFNWFTQRQQPIYQDEQGRFVWGGRYTNTNQFVSNVYDGYKQHFGADDQFGFIGYLAGTGEPPNSVLSELWYVDPVTNEFVQVKKEDLSPVYNFPFDKKWFLKFTFNSVAPALYTFRVASHLAKLTDKDFQKSSTYVYGSFVWAGKVVDFSNVANLAKEIQIDVCTDNYNSLNDNKVLVIYDLTHPGESGSQATKAFSGYIAEKQVDGVLEIPIELMKVTANKNGNPMQVVSPYTDHNGFFFGADGRDDYFVELFGNCGCNDYKKLASFQIGSDSGVTDLIFFLQGSGECPNYGDAPCNRILIKGKVTECDSNIPVPGIGVVLSRGQYAITGADGTFTIIAHDDNYNNNTRVDKLTYVPTICAFKGCDQDCVTPVDIVIVKCVDCLERVLNVSDAQVRFEVIRGLLSAGKYGVGIWGNDWLGREQFVQTKDAMYVSMPSLNETKTFSPSTITLVIPPSVTFPPWMDYLSIGITKELIMGGVYLDWIVDKVEFIDNSGEVNNAAPTQIKIFYGSLVEYNKQNNFNTTTGWNFIVQSAPSQINYTSDYVEFYVNGDGVFFPTLIRALIKYDQTGQFFLIDYDTALKDLKPYALIRLCRPQQCTTQDLFFQLCVKIPVVNGKATQNTIILNAFDTYYKYRQIPIPIGTDDAPENIVRTFGFPFEHHSPSDLWGDHAQNIGRPNTRNPYEAEILRENQVMLSGALSVNGQLNFLNYFDDNVATDFNSWNFGGVVSALPQTGIILVICQFDTFTVGFDDNLLRVTEAGVAAASGSNLFGKPERKIGLNFGCLLFDKNTIQIKEGLVEFLCTKESALIQHDYSNIYIVSRNVVDSYFQSKVKSVGRWNKENENKRFFISSINPAAKEYLLTDFLMGSPESGYVNDEREIVISKNDTIAFDYFGKYKQGNDILTIWRGFYSFTAENYAYLESQSQDLQLFAFKFGIPYRHYTQDVDKVYSQFFGQNVTPVIQPVTVIDGFTKKKFTNAQVYCKTLFWCDKFTTDSNQRTRILKSQWKKGNFMWAAPIPCDLNTPPDPNTPVQTGANKLYDGNNMYGSICVARFVVVSPEANSYFELLGFIIDTFKYEKSGGS